MGRDMADDGRSAHPTMTTAETPRSPTRAEIGRDAIGRRIVRHAIRRRTIRHATPIPDAVTDERDPSPDDTARDAHPRRRDRRQTIRHATILSCPEYARICPDMPGYARICPDDVRLFPMMSRCQDCPATALWGESGPTIRVRCAAGRHGDRHN